jgi:hypothetical protein
MNELTIKKISVTDVTAQEIPALLRENKIVYNKVENVNWPEAFPYCPKMEFGIAHTEDAFLIHYRVEEQSIRAVAQKDNDSVWEDSCAEFFISPAADGLYYNVECNCAGTLLLGVGEGRNNRQLAAPEITRQIDRWTSLGRAPFETRNQPTHWELTLRIPYSVFFRHSITSLDGLTLKGNFYKCGDNLPVPHFISWNPISTPTPDFHCPQFFGELQVQR